MVSPLVGLVSATASGSGGAEVGAGPGSGSGFDCCEREQRDEY
jgi:hypothetical protein